MNYKEKCHRMSQSTSEVINRLYEKMLDHHSIKRRGIILKDPLPHLSPAQIKELEKVLRSKLI